MNQDKANSLARAAGASGRSYPDLCYFDEWAAAVDEIDASGGDVDSETIEAAYCEGRREWRLVGGWKTAWTTAPADYDGFGTETAEGPIEWKGRRLRRVLIDPAFFSWQTGRYGSGGHGDWDEDPRVAEAKRAETLAREKAERDAHEARRAEGLVWIRTAEDVFSDWDSDEVDRSVRSRGLTWKDVRDEFRRRAEEKAAAERAAKWATCRATFKDGDTLVDDGAPARRNPDFPQYQFPGRAAAVYRAVTVKPHYAVADDADEARVIVSTERKYHVEEAFVGSLAVVADRIARGELRVARPDEVFPPKVVVDRLCGSGGSWKDVFRAPSGAWVGRPLFSSELVVLDAAGHLIRRKAVAESALAAYREKMFGGT